MQKENGFFSESIYLSIWPSEIGKLKNLKTLFLASNNISSIPKELYALKGLKRIDLRGNPLGAKEIALLQQSLPKTEVKF